MKKYFASLYLYGFVISLLMFFSANAISAVTFNVITDSAFVGRTTGQVGDIFWQGGANDADLSSFPCCDGVNDGIAPEGALEQIGLNTVGSSSIIFSNLASDGSFFSQTFQTGNTIQSSSQLIFGDNPISSITRDAEALLFADGLLGDIQTLSNAGQSVTTLNADGTTSFVLFSEDSNFNIVSNSINGYAITAGQDPAVVFADPNIFAGADPLISQQGVIDQFNYLINNVVAPGWTAITFYYYSFTGTAKPGSAFGDIVGTGFGSFVSTDPGAIPVAVEPLAVASSTLPASRSAQVSQTVTVFATIVNPNANAALACGIAPITSIPSAFSYQATDNMNNPMGNADTPVDIPAAGTQNFILSFTPSAAFAPTDVLLDYTCSNTNSAVNTVGLNSILLSADTVARADVIGLTTVVDLVAPMGNTSLFAVGSANVGATSDITVNLDDGGQGLPLTMSVCQTDAMGACMGTPASSVMLNYAGNSTASFAVFVAPTAAIANDPANNRIFIRFNDSGGTSRGATSSAVRTQ